MWCVGLCNLWYWYGVVCCDVICDCCVCVVVVCCVVGCLWSVWWCGYFDLCGDGWLFFCLFDWLCEYDVYVCDFFVDFCVLDWCWCCVVVLVGG